MLLATSEYESVPLGTNSGYFACMEAYSSCSIFISQSKEMHGISCIGGEVIGRSQGKGSHETVENSTVSVVRQIWQGEEGENENSGRRENAGASSGT